ncbi:hypothetical protein Scep_017854 [Stephania cephalantha]|uniref:Cysteine-rich receptor-like protein kinase 42 n=1 Tax=Stephania cephalantha TaxID=152367 RepID=A0AAP0ISC7_9MAGN
MSILIWVVFTVTHLLLCSASQADAAPRISLAGQYCGAVRTDPSAYIPNFVKEMETIGQLVDAHLWGTYSSSTNSTTIYSLAQCMNDLSKTDCLLCFAESRTKLPSCLPAISGRIYLDGCFLRYDNYSFYEESVDGGSDRVVCGSRAVDGRFYNFSGKVEEAVGVVVGRAEGVGGLGWRRWRWVVVVVVVVVVGCLHWGSVGGLFSTTKFWNEGAQSVANGGSSNGGIIAAIVIAAFAFCMLSLFGGCVGYKRLKRMKQERENLGRLSSAVSKSNLNFKYETLEKATDYFDPSRKLGEGGAGSVFKGILPDGRVVGVKRLVFNTRQWVDEFFNEVNLISGIKHKNLVQLLGCSIEGPESLLVYEYVVNRSLDQVLFDRSSGHFLTWQQRYNIIVGIAEGLAYLHEGSPTRIIHRDIKCSNILLDENMTAKIADFGLARDFALDKSHISTGIAGTLGYMAPEYLVRGQLTEKADVYSFGVLVLEIVCGRRNTVFMQESSSILQTVKL